jgi:hypothetical protein
VLTSSLAGQTAQQTPDTTDHGRARLIGVYDSQTGEPVAGVQVSDAYSGTYATTTATGTALLTFLTFRGTAGFVELRKLGYQPAQILVSRSDSAPMTEVLDPVASIAPMVVNESYRVDRDAGQWLGFETRCQSKVVSCIRNEDIEKKPLANVADFLVHVDGITVGACGGRQRVLGKAVSMSELCGQIAMHSLALGQRYCRPSFFVDGYEWNPKLGAPIDLVPGSPPTAPYPASSLKGIEVYAPGQPRPLRFSGASPVCGAIVIWTK